MANTIRDIAKAAGVSPSTVSRVVNDSPLISEETKIRVREILKELNYTPNSIGKQLAMQSSFTIGFLINTKSKDNFLDPFFFDMIGGSESVVLSKKYDLSICNTNYLQSDEDFLSRFVYSKKVDGLIIHVSIINKHIVEELNRLEFPYVIIGQPKKGLKGSWVDIDNAAAGELAANHLIDSGYKNISFIGGTKDEPVSFNRLKGYRNILGKFGMEEKQNYIKGGLGTEQDGYNLMNELLSMDKAPDAVICINNYTAFGAMRAIKEKGLTIPDDIGIVTFDDFPLAPYTTPPLTALRIDTFKLGKLAGDMLMEKIENKHSSLKSEVLVPELVIRTSSSKIK